MRSNEEIFTQLQGCLPGILGDSLTDKPKSQNEEIVARLQKTGFGLFGELFRDGPQSFRSVNALLFLSAAFERELVTNFFKAFALSIEKFMETPPDQVQELFEEAIDGPALCDVSDPPDEDDSLLRDTIFCDPTTDWQSQREHAKEHLLPALDLLPQIRFEDCFATGLAQLYELKQLQDRFSSLLLHLGHLANWVRSPESLEVACNACLALHALATTYEIMSSFSPSSELYAVCDS